MDNIFPLPVAMSIVGMGVVLVALTTGSTIDDMIAKNELHGSDLYRPYLILATQLVALLLVAEALTRGFATYNCLFSLLISVPLLLKSSLGIWVKRLSLISTVIYIVILSTVLYFAQNG